MSIKTVNGLAWASVKTRNGLAIASIKAINGVAKPAGKSFSSGQSPDTTFNSVSSAHLFVSQQFTTDQAYTDINTATLIMRRTGTPTGTMKVGFFANSANKPSGAVIGDWSGDVNLSVLTTSNANVSFTFSTKPDLTTATVYHIVISYSNTPDSFNYPMLAYVGASGSDDLYRSGDGSTWTAVDFAMTATLSFTSDS